MLFHSWIHKLLNHVPVPSEKNRRRLSNRLEKARTRLGIEVLEDRLVPSSFVVTNTNDSGSGSLRDAINNAASTSITFDPGLAGQTITLTSGQLVVNHNLTITGLGANQLAISGNHASRVFDIASGSTVQISGLTIENGYALGGSPTFANGQETPNGGGGGILNDGTLTVTDCTMSGNVAQGANGGSGASGGGYGGGITNAGTLTVVGSTLSGNTALGGAGAASNSGGGFNKTFGGGGGGGGGAFGGAIVNLSNSSLQLIDSTISGNAATGGAGGAAYYGNTAGGQGGNSFASAGFGGGASGPHTNNGQMGAFGGGGGGGYSYHGTSGNGGGGGFGGGGGGGGGQSGNGGQGGAYAGSGGRGNHYIAQEEGGGGGGGAGLGGGIFNNGGTVTITSSTLAGNTATGGAGGTGGGWFFDHSHNGSAGQGAGGGIFNHAGTVTVLSTIVAQDTLNNGTAGADVFGALSDSGSNFIGTTSGSSGFGAGTLTGNPGLGSLVYNGGPTQTLALASGSACIGTGATSVVASPFNLTTDQRGLPRETGGRVDIGAYQHQPPAPPLVQVLNIPAEVGTFSGAVATFTVAGNNQTTADFTASIDWGDGTTSTGTVGLGSNGVFTVSGTHTYSAGTYTLRVTLTNGGTSPGTASVQIQVANPTVTAAAVTPTLNTPFNGQVVTFTDGSNTLLPSSFTATIHWGDAAGNSTDTSGNISQPGGSGTLYVITDNTMPHTHSVAGAYTFTVTLTAPGNSNFLASGSGTASVYEAPSITSGNFTNFIVGTAGNFTVTTGPDFPTATRLTESGALPGGLSFTDNGDGTATVSGTPRTDTGGSYVFTITASNGIAPYATQTFTLQVDRNSIVPLAPFGAISPVQPYGGLVEDKSGNLFGTTTNGGASDDGMVFEVPAGSLRVITLASFNGANGKNPDTRLILDSSGDLFGTTPTGGPSGDGTVFAVPAGSFTIITLASFDGSNGANPAAGLVADQSGNLFGTTSNGGAFGDGTVFEVPANSGTITTLASFNGSNGASPGGDLVLDSNGNLFGTTSNGGAFGDGTVFEVPAGSGTITDLDSFTYYNGASPYAGLVANQSGNLFGTTFSGGAFGDGTVFEVPGGSGTITDLDSFTYHNGAYPKGDLVLDSNGNLFGTTYSGGASGYGTVFEVPASSGTITDLDSFTYNNGAYPYAGLVKDQSGTFFGTTSSGGASGYGTVFEVPVGSGTITDLDSFTHYNGASPYAGLVKDQSGNLFGTTSSGGASGYGTVFEVPAGSGSISTLASFDYSHGAYPFDSLVLDSSGDLFGTTSSGGAFGYGTVFELPAGSGTITTLASFDSFTNGASPTGGLVLDSSGNLFGTTSSGGAANEGTVFDVQAGSNTITTLASFNGTTGSNPLAGLVEDQSGNLFGTSSNGGGSDAGTVFEVPAGSGTITTLASFNGSNGSYPYYGSLVLDSSGNLFGTTSSGGAANDGTVFEVAAGSNTITTLATFNGANGQSPYAGLLEDKRGILFGTTYSGGGSGDGTVFEVAAGSNTIITLATFNGVNGQSPYAGLVQDSNGNLFGTAYAGGADADGEVFEVGVAAQSIHFIPPASPIFLVPNETVHLFASGGGSGNPVVFSIDPSSTGAGSISGNILTITGPGTFVLDANQAGTTDYAAAAQVQQTLVVRSASQTINFTPPTTPISFVPNETVGLSATGGPSGNPVVFRIDPSSTGTGSISGSTLTVTGVGTFVLDANQAGNGNYLPAAQVQQTLVVNQATPVIVWTAPAIVYGTPLSGSQLDASANVPGTFTYTPAAGTMLPAGTQTLSVLFTPADSHDYQNASASIPLNVNPATLTITPAAGQSMVEGSSAPTLYYSAGGFVNGDNPLLLTGLLGTTATSTSPAGNYPFTVGTLTAGKNYTLVLATNAPTFTVTDFVPVVSVGSDVTIPNAQMLTRTGSFTDPTTDTWTATVNYGDGSGVQPLALNADKTFILGQPYTVPGDHTVTVSVRDEWGAQGIGSFVVHDLPPATVQGVQINDGSAQRSMVNSITVTFSTTVDIAPGAFTLVHVHAGVTTELSQVVRFATNRVGAETVATVTFVGSGIVGGSLPDGRYTLIIHSYLVHDHQLGAALNGDRVEHFFRLFGDVNSNGKVDDMDRAVFLASYRSRKGMPNYRWYLDYNCDGTIDSIDYYEFIRRSGTTV
jgi:uncharacterized repeat protein (TIGR03803 family)